LIQSLRSNWRIELLHLSLAAMECCWIYPWQTMLLGPGGQLQRLPLGLLCALLYGSSLWTRGFGSRMSSLSRQQMSTLLLMVLSGLVLVRLYAFPSFGLSDLAWIGHFIWQVGHVLQGIPRALVVFATTLFVWWRGIQLAQRSFSSQSVSFSFRVGIVILLWLMLAQLLFDASDARPYTIAYFCVGVFSMGLARVEESSRSQAGIRTPFNTTWLGILLATTLVLGAAGCLLIGVFSLSHISAALGAAQPVVSWLARASRPIQAVAILLLEWILNLLIALLTRAFSGGEAGAPPIIGELSAFLGEFQERQPSPSSLLLWDIIQGAILVLGFGLVLAALAISIGRVQRSFRQGRTAEHETVAASDDAGDEAKRALAERWRRWRNEVRDLLARLRGEGYSLASIRQAYASLTRMAAATGHPRRAAQTPYEYLPSLRQAFPGSAQEVELITEAYVRVHYGERIFEPEYVQQVREAWLAVRSRMLRSGGKGDPS
jgi:hypothetical protein